MFLSKPYYTVIRPLKNFRATHFVTNAQDGDTYYCQDNIKYHNTHCIHITSMVMAPLMHSVMGCALISGILNSDPYWILRGINDTSHM